MKRSIVQYRIGIMQKLNNNTLLDYLIIFGLSVLLLLSQTNSIHMHIEHTLASPGHTLLAHATSSHPSIDHLDFDHSSHHENHISGIDHDFHHASAIDISTDSLKNKSNVFEPLALVFLFIYFGLATPSLIYLTRQKFYNPLPPACFYLFNPPLRAPPAI